MFCIVAAVVFGIIGIFSATHRALAREAFDCVGRRVTLRPCNTGFQEKAKAKILGWLIKHSVKAARIFNKYFEVFSWLFFILMLGSTFWFFRGVYNFYVYGSCNGLNASGFCAFDPSGGNNKISENSGNCGIVKPDPAKVTLTDVDLSVFPQIETNSKDTMVFVGCYGCDYTRKVYPEIKKLLENKNPNFIFAHFPIKGDSRFLSDVGYCVYRDKPEDFWKLNDYLFTAPRDYVLNKDKTAEILINLNLDAKKVMSCAKSTDTQNAVDKQIEEIKKMHVYGTPTIFVNKQPFIGPKPYRVYNSAINKFIFF